jgi:hypothetical protein
MPLDPPEPPPPFLGSWRRVYAFILIYLALVITALYLFTKAYQI